MCCGGWVESLEFANDEPRVVVDVAADGERGDAAVVGAKGGDVGAGHDGWLELWGMLEDGLMVGEEGLDGIAGTNTLCIWDLPQIEIPDHSKHSLAILLQFHLCPHTWL